MLRWLRRLGSRMCSIKRYQPGIAVQESPKHTMVLLCSTTQS